jgi:hypothetical protein
VQQLNPLNRNTQIKNFKILINRNSYPRLEMLMLVIFTGFAGFLTSYSLLYLGLNTMWLRYLVSIGVAYIVFLALWGIWLSWKTNRNSANLDGLDLTPDIYFPSGNSKATTDIISGHGGDFHVGGASGDFSSGSDGEIIGEAFGAAAQAEEAAVPLIVILALILGFFSIFIVTFSLISSAPILFSELLVDGMLSVSLYRRLKGIDSRHWLESAIKKTFWPFTFATLTFVVLGWTIEHFMPHAHSLGDLIRILFN